MKSNIIKFGSVIPSIVIIVSIVIALVVFNLPNPDAEIPVALRGPLITWLIILIFSVILLWVAIVGYIIHIVGYNKSFSGSKKLAWALLIWFFNFFTIPIYWKLYFNKEVKISSVSSSQCSEDNSV